MKSPRRPLASHALALALASLLVGVLAAGCGGAAAKSTGEPASPKGGDSQSQVVQADELVAYEDEIALALNTPRPQAAVQQPPYAEAPATTATTGTNPLKAMPESEGKRAEVGAPAPPMPPQATAQDTSNPCQTACRALTSMTTSANHICDLAGEDNDRCTNARSRVQRAEGLVNARCTCGR